MVDASRRAPVCRRRLLLETATASEHQDSSFSDNLDDYLQNYDRDESQSVVVMSMFAGREVSCVVLILTKRVDY